MPLFFASLASLVSLASLTPLASPLAVAPGTAVVSATPYWPPPERSKKPATKKARPHTSSQSTERLEKEALGGDDDQDAEEKPQPKVPEKPRERPTVQAADRSDRGDDDEAV